MNRHITRPLSPATLSYAALGIATLALLVSLLPRHSPPASTLAPSDTTQAAPAAAPMPAVAPPSVKPPSKPHKQAMRRKPHPQNQGDGNELARQQVEAVQRAAAAAEQRNVDEANTHMFDSLKGW